MSTLVDRLFLLIFVYWVEVLKHFSFLLLMSFTSILKHLFFSGWFGYSFWGASILKSSKDEKAKMLKH